MMNTRNMSLLDVPHRTLELQTNLREDFTIKETAPTRAIFWLRAPKWNWDTDANVTMDGWVGIHSLSHLLVMIFALVSKFLVILSMLKRTFSILLYLIVYSVLHVKALSRGLLRECEIFTNLRLKLSCTPHLQATLCVTKLNYDNSR